MNPLIRPVSDSGKRCSDVIRLHILAGKAGHWAAIRLSDGGSDGIAYETKARAVYYQLHESQCAYICIPPDDMSPASATRFLEINRNLYDAGFRMTDPDSQLMPVLPQRIDQ